MKKLLSLSFLLAVLLITSFKGFSQAYKQGDKLLNATVGLNSGYGGLGGATIPLGISFEVGITEAISVGGFADYTSFKYSGYDYGWSFLYFGGRGSYHVNELLKITNDKLDVYGGLGLGYYTASYSGTANPLYTGAYGGSIFFTGFVGGRYYFTDKIGAVVELGGGGVSNFKVGATFKF
jgi:hypothetical protein